MTQTSFNALNHPFWRFSLGFYESPRVAELCLALQDEQGLDVNCLLFACWLGHQGRRLLRNHPDWDKVSRWQREIVRPLRELRREQPRQTEAEKRLRRLLQESELKAEQCEQWWLFQAYEQLSEASSSEAAAITWANLLDVAQDADHADSRLPNMLHELLLLNHPEADEQALAELSP